MFCPLQLLKKLKIKFPPPPLTENKFEDKCPASTLNGEFLKIKFPLPPLTEKCLKITVPPPPLTENI